MPQPQPPTDPAVPPDEVTRRTLAILRLVWFSLLAAPLLFAVIVAVILSGNQQPPPTGMEAMTFVAGAMFLMTVPAGYFVRMQVYKKSWRGDAITPPGYYIGNLLLLAMCEGTALFGLIATLVQRQWGWPAVISGAAMLVQMVNFPTGAPMRPTNPYQQTQ